VNKAQEMDKDYNRDVNMDMTVDNVDGMDKNKVMDAKTVDKAIQEDQPTSSTDSTSQEPSISTEPISIHIVPTRRINSLKHNCAPRNMCRYSVPDVGSFPDEKSSRPGVSKSVA